MTDRALEFVLRRERTVVLASLAVVTALAWAYILWLVHLMAMGPMAMAGVRMTSNPFGAAMLSAAQPWSAAELAFAFVMWTVMMIGMMTPSAAPMILLYARVGRQAADRHRPIAASGWFAGGYLLAWTAFSAVATVAQWGLDRVSLLNPLMASAVPFLGGAILLAAGLYQWTPLKDACLTRCQAPLAFVQRHGGFGRTPWGSLSLGARHGTYCVGCCWALMLLLFVGGVMNVLWIAAISAFVLAEKVTPGGRILSRTAGVGLVAASAWMFIG